MSVFLFLFTGIANLDCYTLVNIGTSALESINIVSRKLGELKRDFLFYMKAVANFRNHICYLATALFFSLFFFFLGVVFSTSSSYFSSRVGKDT